jgi:hypothetical protein
MVIKAMTVAGSLISTCIENQELSAGSCGEMKAMTVGQGWISTCMKTEGQQGGQW